MLKKSIHPLFYLSIVSKLVRIHIDLLNFLFLLLSVSFASSLRFTGNSTCIVPNASYFTRHTFLFQDSVEVADIVLWASLYPILSASALEAGKRSCCYLVTCACYTPTYLSLLVSGILWFQVSCVLSKAGSSV